MENKLSAQSLAGSMAAILVSLLLVPSMMFFILLATTGPSHAASSSPPAKGASPLDLYGPELSFDIYRNGARIGEHRVQFREVDQQLQVRTDFELSIGALVFTLFKLTYTSDAVWQDGKLVSLAAYTNRNGDESRVNASLDERGALSISGPQGIFETPLGIYPTNHWNAGVVQSTSLLNTITGKVNMVRLEPMGLERVPTNMGPVEAMRYRYVGEIENEVWYDRDGRWVAMQFPGDDGSLIELVCTQCVHTSSSIVKVEATR